MLTSDRSNTTAGYQCQADGTWSSVGDECECKESFSYFKIAENWKGFYSLIEFILRQIKVT